MCVAALILAAGSSQRMGRTKQLLPLKGQTMLERVIRQVLTLNVDQVITVIGHQAEQIRTQIMISDQRFSWLYEPDYQQGQSVALKRGLAHCRQQDVMIFLGDEPFIAETTMTYILQTGRRQTASGQSSFFVRPQYEQIPGHPVYIGRAHQQMTDRLQADQGARSLLTTLTSQLILPVDDWGTTYDIDTPAGYQVAKAIAEKKGPSSLD